MILSPTGQTFYLDGFMTVRSNRPIKMTEHLVNSRFQDQGIRSGDALVEWREGQPDPVRFICGDRPGFHVIGFIKSKVDILTQFGQNAVTSEAVLSQTGAIRPAGAQINPDDMATCPAGKG